MRQGALAVLCAVLLVGCGNDGDDGNSTNSAALNDPGAAAWQPVAAAQVAEQCGLDPALLAAADTTLNRAYAVVRYGRLCHEYYPAGSDPADEVWSTTKTLGGVVTGIASYETRSYVRTGRKTGQLSDSDRVDHWLDSFTFNQDALVGHVLAMEAQNRDLSYGNKEYQYDLIGAIQINRLSDIITAALQQDPQRLGGTVEELTQRFLYAPLGMRDSVWSGGAPDKILAYSWNTTVRDMARLGLLILHDGVWSGQRILDASWTYKMTHPSFEDANTGYGYLTWLNSDSNYTFGARHGEKFQGRVISCAPVALYPHYPHPLSETPNCNYTSPYTCQQTFDVGVWFAAGLGGQYIIGQRALDLVLVVKDLGDTAGPGAVWAAVRPALIALDPKFKGDTAAFCASYASNGYAPFGD